MLVFVIWIDQGHAKVFQLTHEKMERDIVHGEESRIYSELAEKMAGAERILLLGPGVSKLKLQNFLNEHYPCLGRRIVGCENVELPSDHQIATLAWKFFGMGDPATQAVS